MYVKIKQVVSETAICESKGEKHDGMRKYREHRGAYFISSGSIHEQIMCDRIETDLGLKYTTLLLNKELKWESLTEICVSCLRNSYLCLNHVTIQSGVHMGTNDAHLL